MIFLFRLYTAIVFFVVTKQSVQLQHWVTSSSSSFVPYIRIKWFSVIEVTGSEKLNQAPVNLYKVRMHFNHH